MGKKETKTVLAEAYDKTYPYITVRVVKQGYNLSFLERGIEFTMFGFITEKFIPLNKQKFIGLRAMGRCFDLFELMTNENVKSELKKNIPYRSQIRK